MIQVSELAGARPGTRTPAKSGNKVNMSGFVGGGVRAGSTVQYERQTLTLVGGNTSLSFYCLLGRPWKEVPRWCSCEGVQPQSADYQCLAEILHYWGEKNDLASSAAVRRLGRVSRLASCGPPDALPPSTSPDAQKGGSGVIGAPASSTRTQGAERMKSAQSSRNAAEKDPSMEF